MKAIGLEHLLTDARYADLEVRRSNNRLLYAEIAAVLRTRSAQAWEDALNAAGVPASRLRTIPEILSHPQVTNRGVLHRFDEVPGVEGAVSVPLAPFQFAHDGPRARSAPPRVGEHTDAILRELGYDADDIARLREQRVI